MAGRRRQSFVLLLGILVVASAGGVWFGFCCGTPDKEFPLKVDASCLDLGEVWAQDEFSWAIPIKNVSRRAVKIVDFRTSCNCAAVAPRSLIIPPNQIAMLHLTLDLFRANSTQADNFMHNFAVQIAPIVNDQSRPSTSWEITGRVREALRGLGRSIDLGYDIDEPANALVVFAVEGDPLITELEAVSESPHVHLSVSRLAYREPRFEVVVAACETLPTGPFKLPIRLSPLTSAGQSIPSRRLLVVGRRIRDVSVMPESIEFGAVRIGQLLSDDVTLQSRSGRRFNVQIECPEEVESVGLGDPDGSRYVFHVRRRATTIGPRQDMLTFKVVPCFGDAALVLDVPVRYYGLTPAVGSGQLE